MTNKKVFILSCSSRHEVIAGFQDVKPRVNENKLMQCMHFVY